MTTKNYLSIILLIFCLSVFGQKNGVTSIMIKTYDSTTNLIHWPEEFNPTKSSWYVYNEIEINAKPEVVWNILIDAKKWHTFYKGAESPIEFLDSNAKTLQNGLAFKFHTMGLHLVPVMKEFIPNERMAWEVRGNNLKAYHAWIIVPTANGCRLITPEAQNGFLTLMQKIFVPNKLLKLHDTWLKLIKERAESNGNYSLKDWERQELNKQLQYSYQKLMTSIAHLSDSQLHFKQNKKKWSIAECIEHITLAELHFLEILNKEMKKESFPFLREKIKITDDKIRQKMLSRIWRAKSPEIFKPQNKFLSVSETLNVFKTQREKIIHYVNTTNDDLRNHFWKHPLTGHIDLFQTLILMSAHLERHTEQIENIKKLMLKNFN